MEKISRDQIKSALSRSGYLLEYRVEKLLNNKGCFTQANEVYPDPFTGKPRELDLGALRVEFLSKDYKNTFWQRILIECVNNPQPIAFFTKLAIAPTTHIYDMKFSGVPVKIKKDKHWRKISDYLDMQKFHHYCDGRVATQFCSFTSKKNSKSSEWLAQHEDSHFDSFNKLCFALNHEIDEHYSRSKLRRKETMNVSMYYPILVISGELIEILPTKNNIKLKSVDHIHYIQSYISRGRVQNYHIDVVTESYLPKLLTLMNKELKKTAQKMRKHQKEIQRSVDLITSSVKGLRSEEAIRAKLEYRGPWGTGDPA